MKTRNQLLILLLAALSVSMIACSSGNRIGGSSKNCGCGVNKGMVGYR
jgi:hypothetical protein